MHWDDVVYVSVKSLRPFEEEEGGSYGRRILSSYTPGSVGSKNIEGGWGEGAAIAGWSGGWDETGEEKKDEEEEPRCSPLEGRTRALLSQSERMGG
jgi:hypothetical protein